MSELMDPSKEFTFSIADEAMTGRGGGPRLGSSSTEFMMKAMRAGFLEQEHGTGIF